MKYPCIESTIEIKIGSGILRLWINESELKIFHQYNNLISAKILEDFIETVPLKSDVEIIEYAIANIKGLNAIQVIEESGDIRRGVVVYTVPFNDLKG